MKSSGPDTRDRRYLVGNVVARVIALVSLGVSTVLVARMSGPAGVGLLALLRVLPGMLGVVVSGGLPTGVAYFLARPQAQGLRATIVTMGLAAGALGSILWVVAAPGIQSLFFSDLSVVLVAAVGLMVLTQLVVATGKGCCQGTGDLPGSNQVIMLEELTFLPAYSLLWALSMRGASLIIGALLVADVATGLVAWRRLARRGYFHEAGATSFPVMREVWWYGTRGEIGAFLSLVNLRLDFALLDVFAGTAVVGMYAVASKFAELVRLAPLAITYVLYPRFAREGEPVASADARRLLRPATALTLATAIPLAAAAPVVLPVLYGQGFSDAVFLSQLLLVGLALEGAASVVTAYLYGTGHPGLNSLAMGVGVVLTVVLDALLIPRWGATGAAIASTAAYLVTTAALLATFKVVTRKHEPELRPISWRMS
jgi:O-antigen/teichoic acid export membrane protein